MFSYNKLSLSIKYIIHIFIIKFFLKYKYLKYFFKIFKIQMADHSLNHSHSPTTPVPPSFFALNDTMSLWVPLRLSS